MKIANDAPLPSGRVPRIARLMALAIRFDDLLLRGEVKDYAELARLGHVRRARAGSRVRAYPVKEWQVRPVAAEPLWARQRSLSKRLPPTLMPPAALRQHRQTA
jgi:hypothetical protein